MLDQLAAVLRADAVEHLGGVEGARHGAGPALALQHPAQQDGVDLVRIDEVAVLVGRANAVRIAVRAEAGLAAVGHHRLAQRANVRLNRLRIDARKQRVGIASESARWRRRCA